MQYRLRGTETAQTVETKGTIQNIGNFAAEISTSEDFSDSFILRSWDRITFSQPLYIRARDSKSGLVVLNVLQDFFLSNGGGTTSGDSESFKSAKVVGNSVNFYTSSDTSTTPAFTFDTYTASDTSLTISDSKIKVNISKDADNTLELKNDGLFVDKTEYTASDTSLTISDNKVKANISENVGNTLELKNDGLFVGKTEYTASDTSLTISGNKIKTNISGNAENALELKNDGLFVDISGKMDLNTDTTSGNVAIWGSDGAVVNSSIDAESLVIDTDLESVGWATSTRGNTTTYLYGKINKGDIFFETSLNPQDYPCTISGGNVTVSGGGDQNVSLAANGKYNFYLNSVQTAYLLPSYPGCYIQGGNYISITNTGDYVSFYGFDGTITNTGDYVSIRGGNSTITNTGDYVSISCNYNDTITNKGDCVTINGGVLTTSIRHTITNSGDYVSIYGSANAITSTGDYVTINSGSEDSTITNKGDYVIINPYRGNDTITNTGDHVTIQGVADEKTIINKDGMYITYVPANNCYHTIYGYNLAADIINARGLAETIQVANSIRNGDTKIVISPNGGNLFLKGITEGKVKIVHNSSAGGRGEGIVTIGGGTITITAA